MSSLCVRSVVGGPLEVNTYVVSREGHDRCVVIDPGAEVADVLRVIGGRTVSAVLLTHAHFDHMLYASYWLEQGAKLYIHRLDAPALSEPKLNLSGMLGLALQVQYPDVLLGEGSIIEEAGLRFEVLHTPGHTVGSVCYQCEDALFSGDTMFYRSWGRVDFPGGNGRAMQESLNRLRTLDGSVEVYPGHGPKTSIALERGNRL